MTSWTSNPGWKREGGIISFFVADAKETHIKPKKPKEILAHSGSFSEVDAQKYGGGQGWKGQGEWEEGQMGCHPILENYQAFKVT